MKEIKLSQGKVALIDDEDFIWLSQWKWCANKNRNTFYVVRHTHVSETGLPRTLLLMHRLILEKHGLLQPGHEVDHINGDGLNNQKYNLRSVTPRQNLQNRVNGCKKSSQFPGVDWTKQRNKWRSRIQINGKQKHLGYFDKEEDAALAYIVEIKKLKEEVLCLGIY